MILQLNSRFYFLSLSIDSACPFSLKMVIFWRKGVLMKIENLFCEQHRLEKQEHQKGNDIMKFYHLDTHDKLHAGQVLNLLPFPEPSEISAALPSFFSCAESSIARGYTNLTFLSFYDSRKPSRYITIFVQCYSRGRDGVHSG